MLLRVAERQPDPWLDLLVYTSPSTGPAAPGAWRGGRGERPRSSRSFPPNKRIGQLATGLGRIGRSNRRARRGPAGWLWGRRPVVRPHMLCTASVDSPRQLVAAVVSGASPCSASRGASRLDRRPGGGGLVHPASAGAKLITFSSWRAGGPPLAVDGRLSVRRVVPSQGHPIAPLWPAGRIACGCGPAGPAS